MSKVEDWQKTSDLSLCSQDDTRDIFLDGIVARNRALNGDVVVVQILPREQWKVHYTCPSKHCIRLICKPPNFGKVLHTSSECISR